MQHHYLVTEDVPEVAAVEGVMPAVTDLEGFTYLQREHDGVLLGVYETNPRHWHAAGPGWDYGMELIPEEIDRISPELAIGFERFPALQRVGIKRWVNGAITFTPDGNPLVGPVPGRRGYWAACGVMAGFSQGAGIGLALASWIVDGDPGEDVFGMDVARFGSFAANDAYLRQTTRQFYARRFLIAYPNEELPAGRPLKTSPVFDDLHGVGARFGVVWGLEVPQYFAPSPDFEETLTLGRSNAHAVVGEEVRAVREAAGLYETAAYARYEVTGPGARGLAGPPDGRAAAVARPDPARPHAQSPGAGWWGTSPSPGWPRTGSGSSARTTCRSGTCGGSTTTFRRPVSRCTTSATTGSASRCPGRVHATCSPGSPVGTCRTTRSPSSRAVRWTSGRRARWWGASRSPASSDTS